VSAALAQPSDLLAAIHFAAERHRKQRRKDADASPYVNHAIQVGEVLARVGGVTDRDVLLAAVLHDTIEDTETTRDEIASRFGEPVASLVAEVSDDKTLPKEERKRLQVEHASALSMGAKLIKLGDKICNVRDVAESPPADWTLERRVEYLAWSRRVVDGCRDASAALARNFDEVVGLAEARLKKIEA
jgi:GTP diphosphokinase / guanosine-3',5'-bis(diphosphate) 3'-diphosphatase